MNLNASFFGQTISFVIFVWLCMKYVWPPLTAMLDERQRDIAKGLQHSEDAAKELIQAKEQGEQLIEDARQTVSKMISQGQKRREQLVDEAVQEAKTEQQRIIAQGKAEVTQERNKARQELKMEMADLVIESAKKLINQNLDTTSNRQLVSKLINELE